MKINCLSCGHTIDLNEVYSDYEGHVEGIFSEAQ
jgi:hypothetical protein